MAALIRHGRIEKLLSPDTSEADARIADAAYADAGEVLRLEPADDPAQFAHRLGAVARIEVNFPSLADGRGYSIARLLRERYGYGGELRAVGDVQRDQLYYLARCGFDAFLLRKDEDADDALAAFDDFSETYQASVERPQPLFRRRFPEREVERR
jgi:uncharacterized protein (DUF934 family)